VAATPGALPVAADASGQLKFDQNTLAAKAGNVRIEFTNNSPIAHNFTLLRGSVTAGTATFKGGKRILSTTLPAGKYQYICTVAGHAQAGMSGTLTIN